MPTSLQLSATDPNNDELGYGASGLPPGLSINTTTGAISGTPTASGNFNVVVAASDGVNYATQSFVWTITDPAPLQVQPPPPPAPMLSGGTVTYTANVSNGLNARVRWDFDDGTPVTPYSTSTTITHTFTQPGVYYVTVTAIDDRNLPVSQTFVQIVHLPLTANRPNSSSNIAWEARAAGNRVWVVNQDNDTRQRVQRCDQREGRRSERRHCAAHGRGRAGRPDLGDEQAERLDQHHRSGVAERRADARAAARVAAVRHRVRSGRQLRRSSRCEATGAVLKLNPSTGAVLGTLNVGANPRHLSVSQNGQSIYVSRFITPPVPGESTAVGADRPRRGGDRAVSTSSPFAVVRTITLAHSDLPDFETQGRGIPNYLGAAVISPDGTQAWVPSKQDNIARGTLRDGATSTSRTRCARSARASTWPPATEDSRRAHRPRQLEPRQRGRRTIRSASTCSSRWRRAAKSPCVDAHGRWEVFRFDVGRAPQGLVVSPDGSKLFVNNFMDRTVERVRPARRC